MSNQRYASVLDLQGLTYYHSKITEMINKQDTSEIKNQVLANKDQLDALNLKINNLQASDINAVPASRKINNKALTADISLTAADIGALASGATATAASKVTSNLTIKLNSGTTEGTNLFTFNGSSAKTINITPENIAALPAAGGTITGNLTVNGNISIGTRSPAIKLTVDGFNYIKGNASSSVAFCLSETTNQANTTMYINSTGANPGASDTYSLGSSSLKWKNIYATTFTGALSGNASSATTLSSTLVVEKGGTGASSPAQALANLGVHYGTTAPSSPHEGMIWLEP